MERLQAEIHGLGISLLSQASTHDDGIDRKLRGEAENIQASREQTPLLILTLLGPEIYLAWGSLSLTKAVFR